MFPARRRGPGRIGLTLRTNYVTSRPAAPTKDAAPPAVKAGWSRHPEPVVVVLVNAASEDVVARVRDITNGEMAYIPLMPIFAVDILKVGADGQGWLMGIGGVAAKGGNASKTLLIIGGGIMSGVSVAAVKGGGKVNHVGVSTA